MPARQEQVVPPYPRFWPIYMMKRKDGNLLLLFARELNCLRRFIVVYYSNMLITSESTVVVPSHPLWGWQGLHMAWTWDSG